MMRIAGAGLRVLGWLLMVTAGLGLVGCATMPSDTHAALMADAASAAGFQPALGSLHLRQVNLKPEVMTCHYMGEEGRQVCWVLRFAESPFEQKPGALRDAQQLLDSIAEDKADFQRSHEVAIQPVPDRSVNVRFYAFKESDAAMQGCVCVWREPLGYGAWVYVLNMVSPDALTQVQVEAVLKAMPGFSS